MSGPPIKYARRDGLHLAYQVIGDGAPDMLWINDWGSNIELFWEEPLYASMFREISSLGRLIQFDMRGSGGSDRVTEAVLPAEFLMTDVEIVLDAVGSERVTLMGMGNGGQAAMLFAATHPQRVASLALYNSYARLAWAPDYPEGLDDATQEAMLSAIDLHWGTGKLVKVLCPSVADEPGIAEWWAKCERQNMSPGSAMARARMTFELDVRDVLSSIQCPTLVLHQRGNLAFPVELSRALVEGIPNARYAELPGADHWPFGQELLAELRSFVTGEHSQRHSERRLSTVLLTDIVGSTERAVALGDARWRRLVERHDEAAQRVVARHRGRYVKSTGDGLLATFDGPAQAIEAAKALHELMTTLDLTIRAGVHTGEVELLEEDIAGIAVHVAARICGLATGGQTFASRIVRDLVAGSGLVFTTRGTHDLKGVPEPLEVYQVG